MKTAIFSDSLSCDNKDTFTSASTEGYDGVVLDFDSNTLPKLPSRNYYIMQSLRTEVKIPALSYSTFENLITFERENLQQAKDQLDEIVIIAKNMQVPLVLVSVKEDTLITEDQLDVAGVFFNYASALGESLGVKIGVYKGMTEDVYAQISKAIETDCFVNVSQGFEDWNFKF